MVLALLVWQNGAPFRRQPHLGLPRAALLLVLTASLSLISCAGGPSSASGTMAAAPSTTGTPAGQYALTLTAASGNSVQALQLELSVR
jgi:hypothetical protein